MHQPEGREPVSTHIPAHLTQQVVAFHLSHLTIRVVLDPFTAAFPSASVSSDVRMGPQPATLTPSTISVTLSVWGRKRPRHGAADDGMTEDLVHRAGDVPGAPNLNYTLCA